jgi:hypothetical protein
VQAPVDDVNNDVNMNVTHACQEEDKMDLYLKIKEMIFPCEEVVFLFYNSYAKDNGFGIRLDKVRYSKKTFET